MDLRKSIFTSLLLAIGFILHQIVPGIFTGMKFDILLSVVFISIIINTDFKNAMLTGILSGVISALTTTFPGGQLPNVIDKIVTSLVIFAIVKLLGKYKSNIFGVGFVAFVGTIVSGSVFLYSALLITGLPAPFMALFVAVVLPASAANIFASVFLYKAVNMAFRVTMAKTA